ncbi:MAG: SH3 domain-containing protein [Eubacterium sp.]|nr:SH3 domain-containing protein [Eubacterium sp.]
MFKPSKKIAALVISSSLMISCLAVSAEEKKEVYDQSNVGISAAVDRYVASSSQADLEKSAKVKAAELEKNAKDTDTKKSANKSAKADSSAKYPQFAGKALVISEDAVNIREKASKESEAVGYLGYGYVCTVIENDKEWTKIEFGDCGGYVKTEFLKFGDAAGAWAEKNLRKIATVKVSTLRVRTEASLSAEVITLIPEGGVYTVLEEGKEWTKISIDTDEGYVSSEYVDVSFEATEGCYFVDSDTLEYDPSETEDSSPEASKSADSEVYGDSNEEDTEEDESYYSYEDTDDDDSDSDSSDDDAYYSDDDSSDDDSYYSNDDSSDDDDSYYSNDDSSDDDDSYYSNDDEETTEEYTEEETTTEEEYYTEEETTEEDTEEEYTSDGSVTQLKLDLVNYALQFVGNPYVYGGTDLVNGCDCSGFTYSVFAHFGYGLWRGAEDQVFNGRQIPISEVEPGDLLFYGSIDDIGHVVIYIGNGYVVHASSPEVGIIISPMDYRTPVAATRVIE